MNTEELNAIFLEDELKRLLPPERTRDFFEALFGSADEGAYDIMLSFHGYDEPSSTLVFHVDLHERPGCCLACNLTYGLPEVFSRHPVINLKGLVAEIEHKLDGTAHCREWKLGTTVQQSKSLHSIPLYVVLTHS